MRRHKPKHVLCDLPSTLNSCTPMFACRSDFPNLKDFSLLVHNLCKLHNNAVKYAKIYGIPVLTALDVYICIK